MTGPQGGQGSAGVPDLQVLRHPDQLVPDERGRSEPRRRTRCRSTSPRSRSSTSSRSPTARSARPAQFKYDIKANKAFSRGRPAVEPVRAVPPPRRPEPPRAESAEPPSSWPGCSAAAGYEAPRSRSASQRATSCSRGRPSCRRTCGGSATRTSWPCCCGSSCSAFRSRGRASTSSSARELRERLAGAGLLVERRRRRSRRRAPRPARRAADRVRPRRGAEGHADHVPGVHRPSVALAHLTVRGRGERALDLCTGNGIQAILLAAHAEHVVATDVNPQGARVRGVQRGAERRRNVETRHGSFFEPVEGEQFDLVVANPPYVVSPESAFLFRDSGMEGDAVSEHVVRAAPAVLAPGGVRIRPDRLGARPGRPCGRRAAGWGLRLRRVPAPHLDRRPDRDRDRLEPRPPRPARGVRRRARPLARVLPRARDRAARLRVPRPAQARRRPRRLDRGAAAAARGAPPGRPPRTHAVRDARPARRAERTACSTGGCASSTTRSSPRTRASRTAAGSRRA